MPVCRFAVGGRGERGHLHGTGALGLGPPGGWRAGPVLPSHSWTACSAWQTRWWTSSPYLCLLPPPSPAFGLFWGCVTSGTRDPCAQGSGSAW